MKFMDTSTTAISIVIAIVLFAIATLIEGDPPPPELVPDEQTPRMITTVRRDSALRGEETAEACRSAEERMLSLVAESQFCEVDEDCTILDYGYPLQCMTSIAQSQVSAFRLEYRNYEELCEYRVYYDCPSEPLVRVPVCRNNRCEVELNRNEILKQITMDHIGQ